MLALDPIIGDRVLVDLNGATYWGEVHGVNARHVHLMLDGWGFPAWCLRCDIVYLERAAVPTKGEAA